MISKKSRWAGFRGVVNSVSSVSYVDIFVFYLKIVVFTYPWRILLALVGVHHSMTDLIIEFAVVYVDLSILSKRCMIV